MENKPFIAFVVRCFLVAMSIAWLQGLAPHTVLAAMPAEGSEAMLPRIANLNLGRINEYPMRLDELARYDLVILGFFSGNDPDMMRSVVQGIKERNPNIYLGNYTRQNVTDSTPGTAYHDVYQKVHGEKGPNGIGDWVARQVDGTPRGNWGTTWHTNITRFVTPDADGKRLNEWMTDWYYDRIFRHLPELDLWFIDNFFYRPRSTPDWDGDGRNDSPDDPVVRTYFREAYAEMVDLAHEAVPGIMVAGNVDGPGSSAATGFLNDPEYRHKLNGALFEAAMGNKWSFETWGAWEQMMDAYRHLMANTLEPHLVMFHAIALPGDYRMARYIIASALMDDGYVAINNSGSYATYLWFDEYDLAGTASTKWLGRAIDPPQREPWQNGVYMRRFENGMVLVNPKGNGRQTVEIEPGYRRFQGKQDPVTNNGEPATTVTLEERDGLLLVTM